MPTTFRNLVLPFALGAAACTSQGSEITEAPPNLWSEPANSGVRNFVDVDWNVSWEVGGEADTLFFTPTFLKPWSGGVMLFDRGGQRVQGLDTAGRPAFRFGVAGQGPGEFSRDVTGLVEAPNGSIYALDAINGKIVERRQSGELRDIGIKPLDFSTGGLVTLSDGSFIIVARTGGAPLVHVSPSGEVVERHDLSWPPFGDFSGPLRSGAVAQKGDDWLFHAHYGNAWLPYRGKSPRDYLGQLVEHDAFPRSVVQVSGNTRRTSLMDANCTACSVSIDSDSVYVLHGGGSEEWQQIVDIYDLEDGSYEYSWRLPVRLQSLVVNEGTIFGYYVKDNLFPTLVAYRAEAAADPLDDAP